MKIRYAAYGSNLHPLRLRSRVSSARLLGTSYLPDWALQFHKRGADRSAKCNIVPANGGVHVAVYQFEAAGKLRLDSVEGVGNGYVDQALTVPGFGRCYAYFAQDSHIAETLKPFDWYKQLVILGCRHLGLPSQYVADIDAIDATIDSDPQRSHANWNTVAMLRRSNG